MRTLILFAALLIFIAPVMAEKFVPVDKMPKQISMAQPVYPEKAKQEGVIGSVIVKAYIDKSGAVTEAEVIECEKAGYGFEAAAVEAALQSRFKPAEQEGKPVGVWITYKVQFKLDDKKLKK